MRWMGKPLLEVTTHYASGELMQMRNTWWVKYKKLSQKELTGTLKRPIKERNFINGIISLYTMHVWHVEKNPQKAVFYTHTHKSVNVHRNCMNSVNLWKFLAGSRTMSLSLCSWGTIWMKWISETHFFNMLTSAKSQFHICWRNHGIKLGKFFT